MRELADELGIKLGNLQYYFNTREALILAVIEAEAAEDLARIRVHQSGASAPRDAFLAIVADLVTRWRGSSGVLMSLMGTLALHSDAFRQLYRSVYAEFYRALEAPIKAMNPTLTGDEVAVRVRLVTALIDGSPMQTQVGSRQSFLERVQAQAAQIAQGHQP